MLTNYRKAALLFGVLIITAGCAGHIPTAKDAADAVTRSPIPFEDVLVCIAKTRPMFTVAVGDFTDDTGAYIPDGGGKQFPQGLRKMASSAISVAGVREVARSAAVWRVVKLERMLAKTGHLGDGKLRIARNGAGRPILTRNGSPIMLPTRAVQKADVLGSTLILEGSITGFDANLIGGGAKVNVSGYEIGHRTWTGRFYGDARLIDTISTRTVAADSFARTISGNETNAGMFAFHLGALISVSAGVVQQEGLALSTRATVNMTVASLIAQVHPPAMDCLPDDLKPRNVWREKYVPGSVAPKSIGMLPARPKKLAKAPATLKSKQLKASKSILSKQKRKSVLVKPGTWKLPDCTAKCAPK